MTTSHLQQKAKHFKHETTRNPFFHFFSNYGIFVRMLVCNTSTLPTKGNLTNCNKQRYMQKNGPKRSHVRWKHTVATHEAKQQGKRKIRHWLGPEQINTTKVGFLTTHTLVYTGNKTSMVLVFWEFTNPKY